MDFTSIWEYFAGQNSTSLAAVGSVALGITLILAAGIVHLKRVRTLSRQVAPVEIPVPVPQVEEIHEPVAAPTQAAENPELIHLLRRLKAAADKLDKKRADRLMKPALAGDSSLKRSPSGVEYIHRAGTG